MKEIKEIKSLFSKRLEKVNELVNLTNKTSVLVIQQFPINSDTSTLIPNVRESISNILAFIELGEVNVLKEIIKLADGKVDSIVLDSDVKCNNSEEIIQYTKSHVINSKLFYYSDNNTWADAAINFLQQANNGIYGKDILLIGEGLLYDTVKRKLKDYKPNLVKKTHKKPIDIIIGANIKSRSVGLDQLELVDSKTNIYDLGIGNFSHEFITSANNKGASIFRIDNRAGISSMILNILETDYLISNVMGTSKIKDTEIVAGGAMGSNGSIIIDDINNPSYVLGVADGKGNIKSQLSKIEKNNIAFIERLIKSDN